MVLNNGSLISDRGKEEHLSAALTELAAVVGRFQLSSLRSDPDNKSALPLVMIRVAYADHTRRPLPAAIERKYYH